MDLLTQEDPSIPVFLLFFHQWAFHSGYHNILHKVRLDSQAQAEHSSSPQLQACLGQGQACRVTRRAAQSRLGTKGHPSLMEESPSPSPSEFSAHLQCNGHTVNAWGLECYKGSSPQRVTAYVKNQASENQFRCLIKTHYRWSFFLNKAGPIL